MVVAPDLDTTVYVRKVDTGSDCTACIIEDSAPPKCSEELTLRSTQNSSVDFTCPQPQDVFAVEINRNIGRRKVSSPVHPIFQFNWLIRVQKGP